MKRMLAFALTLLLTVSLCSGFSAAAETEPLVTVTVTPTEIRADSVFNTNGYGSLHIAEVQDEEDDMLLSSPPKSALICADGTFIMPYKDTFLRYYYSSGVVSLVDESYAMNHFFWEKDETPAPAQPGGGGFGYDYHTIPDVPGYCNTDGTELFDTALCGGTPMTDGYALVLTELPENERHTSEKVAWADVTKTLRIVDKTGATVYTFPEEFGAECGGKGDLNWGEWGFLSTAGWPSEGLIACGSLQLQEESYRFQSDGYIRTNGTTAFTVSGYSNCFPFYEGLAEVISAETGKHGFIDKAGQEVIPCQYEDCGSFCDGYAWATSGGKVGYIDADGNTVIPFEYEEAYGAGSGLFSVVKDGKCGLVDAHNTVVVPLIYDDISSFEKGAAYAIKDGKVTLITLTPAVAVTVTPTEIRADGVFNSGGYGSLYLGTVRELPEEPWFVPPQAALIDRDGTMVFDYKDTFLRYRVSDGVVSLTGSAIYTNYYLPDGGNDLPAYYTLSGTPLFDNTAGYASPMYGGYAFVQTKDSARLVDRRGQTVYTFPESYTNSICFGGGLWSDGQDFENIVGCPNEGLIACFKEWYDRTWTYHCDCLGYLDMTGRQVLTLDGYSNLFPFYEGLAEVISAETGKHGFIDKTGQEVIPCQYEDCGNFCDGYAWATSGGKVGYIDADGNTVIPFEYEEAYGAGGGLFSVVKDGKCGLVDKNNTVVVPLIYDDISSFEKGAAYAIRNGKVTLITAADHTAHHYAKTVTPATTKKAGAVCEVCTECGKIRRTAIAKIGAVTLSQSKYTYTGKALKPAVTVKDSKGKVIPAKYYTVTYLNNTKAGTGSVQVTFKDRYSGTVTRTFTIAGQPLAAANITLSYTSKVYTGKALKPAVTVKNKQGTKLTSAAYTVTYQNNTLPGKATVTVKGKGNYTGTVSKTFTVTPKAPSAKVSAGKKQVTVTWNKVTGASGYQIQRASDKAFSKNKKQVTATGTRKVLTGLTSGKTVYVRVRAYKTVSGTRIYGAWSAVLQAKVK